ncbi:hypothetical protein ACEPAI_6994 [Sanghuangporus weigelae]
MRLRALLSEYPKSLIDALDSCGIKTDEDHLCSSSLLPELCQRLPPDSMTFSQLQEIREIAIKSLSATGSTGTEILEGSLMSENGSDYWPQLASTCPRLTELLNATQTGVIEVGGDKGSGKTAVILNAALACLEASDDNIVHWIDTIGDFSAERASRILNCGSWSQSTGASSGSVTDSSLNRLNVSLAFTPAEARGVLASIRSQAGLIRERQPSSVRLVVIDPITQLFTPHIGFGSSEGQAMMSAFMRSLQDLAVELEAIALIANNASTALSDNAASCFESIKLKPALGLTMTFLTHTTLWLTPAKNLFTNAFKSGVDDDESISLTVSELLHSCREEDLDSLYIAEVLRTRYYTGPTWWSCQLDENGVLMELVRPQSPDAPKE